MPFAWLRSLALLALVLTTGRLGAAQVAVASSQLRLFADTSEFWCLAETAGGADLLYYNPVSFPGLNTTRQVFNLDGTPVDLQSAVLPSEIVQPVTASGSGLGASISMAKRFGNLHYGSSWTIVADPHTGTGEGFVRIVALVTNNKLVPANVGYRLELDVQLIDINRDDAFLSSDNGLSVYDRNTLIQAITAPVPSDWWAYDAVPSPNLVARGVTWGNGFGLPASQPDAIEFCHWAAVAGTGFYEPHPEPGRLFSSYERQDTAVVLWYTNTGQALGNGYSVAPGQTLAWVTYYGLNQGTLGQTPTPYITFTNTPTRTPSPTISPTHTISPTFTVSPTISPTFTASPTFTVSPTFSVSPTISPTFTASPTLTATPSFSHSPTRTLSFTHSPTFTASPTPTATPSFSHSPTRTPSFTHSPTPSITLSLTASPTHTASPTVTITPQPDLLLTPKPPNPSPSKGKGVWLPYLLSRDAEVRIRIFTVAGETVRDLDPFAGRWGANEQFWDERNNAGARVASGIFIGHIVARADGKEADAWIKIAVAR
jgi:hypothetical protein